ncbi:MAG: STAS domain-containing protein [Phycisphaerales bacterium]|nr:STAS domain-containing protein [Phycisphaerales bacterium]
MPIQEWSAEIIGAVPTDEAVVSSDLAELITRLKAGIVAHVVVDCASIAYLNSSHLTQLVALHRLLKRNGRRLVLCAVSANVHNVLQVSGFGSTFHFAPDVACALDSLKENPPGRKPHPA